jgi:hypothetical protein
MTTLRNEILTVKELTKRFVSAKFKSIQLSEEKINTIEKSVVAKLGFSKVIGLKIEDVKNERFNPKKVGYVNPISGMKYTETEYVTKATWLFE